MSAVVAPLPDASTVANTTLPARKVLVAVAEGTDPQPLEDALTRGGMEPLFVDESPVSGSLDEVLSERLQNATALVAVLIGPPSTSVLYAIGFARGLGKRVVVLADEPGRALPEGFPTTIPVFHGTLRDGSKLDDVIQAARHPIGPPSHGRLRPRRVLGTGIADAIQKRAIASLDDLKVMGIVADLLSALGILASEVNETDRLIAVWVEGLEPWIGNPFLIHTTGLIGSATELAEVVSRFDQSLRARGGDWGLIVAGGLSHDVAIDRRQSSRTLVTSLPQLLLDVRNKPLVDVILDLRRARVRGRG